MENLKIRVNGEAESKEAQELFFELGYQWAYKNIGKDIFYKKENIFLYADKGGNLRTGTKENKTHFNCWFATFVSRPKLRDLVVLKRNNVGDATHVDKIDPNFKYRFINNAWHVITENYQSWREDSFTNSEAGLHIKPIEKPMKEYLRKNNDGEYILEVTDEREAQEPHAKHWIEIPERADIYAISKNWEESIFFAKSGGDTLETFNTTNKNDWHQESTLTLENLEINYSILWQRHTHPEELPFIDDEPKITTAKGSELDYIAKIHDMRDRYNGESDEDYRYQLEHYISRKEPSLNDQYAEIEKVRQSHRTASEIADSALKHIRERAETYDQPTGERSAAKTAKVFNAITGKDITESEVWLLLQLLKDVRQWSREDYHQDSAEDCIAYAALKAESLEGGE